MKIIGAKSREFESTGRRLPGLATGKLVSKFKRELDYCSVLNGTGKRLTRTLAADLPSRPATPHPWSRGL